MSNNNQLFSTILGISLAWALLAGQSGAHEPLNTNQEHFIYPSESGHFLAGRSALAEGQAERAATFFIDALTEDDDNGVLLNRALTALLAAGRIKEAGPISRRLTDLDPDHEAARLLQGLMAVKERRYHSAEAALSGLSRYSLTGVTGTMILAWAQIGLGDVEKGYETLTGINTPGFADFIVFQHALMADVSGDRKTAADLFAKAHENDPYVVSITEAYARFLANEGDFDAAMKVIGNFTSAGNSHTKIDNLREIITSGKRPGKTVSTVQQGASEVLRGVAEGISVGDRSTETMLAMIQLAVYVDSESALALFTLANRLEQAGHFDKANDIYGRIGKKSVLYKDASIRAAGNLFDLGDPDKAIVTLQGIVRQYPDNISAYLALGDTLRFQKRYAEAVEIYSKALAIAGGEKSSDWRLYYVRGIMYERQDIWEKAEADFKAALHVFPNQPQVLNYLGYSWVDMGINLHEALELIEIAAAERPDDGAIVDSLGWAYYRLERYEDAVEVLERATRLEPSDPTINDHLGDAYWQVGRKREARFQWHKAREMEPDEELLQQIIDKLASGKPKAAPTSIPSSSD